MADIDYSVDFQWPTNINDFTHDTSSIALEFWLYEYPPYVTHAYLEMQTFKRTDNRRFLIRTPEVGSQVVGSQWDYATNYTIRFQMEKNIPGRKILLINGTEVFNEEQELEVLGIGTFRGIINMRFLTPLTAFPLTGDERPIVDNYSEDFDGSTFTDSFNDNLMTDWGRFPDSDLVGWADNGVNCRARGVPNPDFPESQSASMWHERQIDVPPPGTDEGDWCNMITMQDGRQVGGYIESGALKCDIYDATGSLTTVTVVASGMSDGGVFTAQDNSGLVTLRTPGGGTRKKSRNPDEAATWVNE